VPPVEPPPSVWDFPPATTADRHGVVGVGADLEPGTLLRAYRSGIFPMPLHRRGPMAWWSPNPRAIIPLDRFQASRSLRKSRRRYTIRVDTAFSEVIAACADPDRPHGWITPEIRAAYTRLNELGWVHSVEAWTVTTGSEPAQLAGGLYGVAIGGLFAGESMFHRATDASKVALAALVDILRAAGTPSDRVLDVQWATDHLVSLGAVEIPTRTYLGLIERAVALPLPADFR
jgi:leucyl/phenylalanyl-tRNA--protein transferase